VFHPGVFAAVFPSWCHFVDFCISIAPRVFHVGCLLWLADTRFSLPR